MIPTAQLDLTCQPGKPDGLNYTRELHSATHGYLASISAEDDQWLTIFTVSTMDHITEPRAVEEYSIRKVTDISQRWGLFRDMGDGRPVILGQFTDEEGAKRILDYLKAHAQ